MKIVIVCYPTFGGSGVMATELGMSLVDHGHEVHFIAYKKPVRLNDLNENLYFHKVNVPDYPLFSFVPYELALSYKISKHCKEIFNRIFCMFIMQFLMLMLLIWPKRC